LSKLSTLKQEAYQAGKKKNWAQAIMLYEQILERDKNNPTVINELGDLCLKGDETQRAVRYFLSAASKYRTTGLLNNSVAIYKKILRHDAENLNAHWYLAETRANQGLTVEGENHAVHFLDNSENVAGDIKEIFLKRCQGLFDLFPQSRVILSRLSQIFRIWSMSLEAARADCLLICMDFAGGKEDEARRAIDDLTAKVPEVMNYPEFTKWNGLLNPDSVVTSNHTDFGSISLGTESAEPTPAPAAAEVSGDTSFGDLNLDAGPAPVVEVPNIEIEIPSFADEEPEVDDDGCFAIDDEDSGTNFDDLIAQATSEENDRPAADVPGEESVDLLTRMLEEEGPDLTAESSGELATITSEIGAVVGGDEDDAGRMYEMGMVYLEMGLFDQACDSFKAATDDAEYAVRAHEMWGITLQRANRHDEAITVLNDGLEFAAEGSHERHGLMYHLGLAKEKIGHADEAIECFRKINDVDPKYLDVGRRLAKLTAV
jgi:tetratricopeptide (TPR) repeat protein